MIHAVLYVLFVVLANILAARWTIPLAFGLAVPAGVFAIAPVFSVRDGVHEKLGKRWAYALIAAAAAISYVIAWMSGDDLLGRVTLASVVAFVSNESLDTEIYHQLRQRSKLVAILGSNAVSSLVDSILFIWIAFGPMAGLMAGQYIVKMAIAGVVGLWMTRSDSMSG